MNPEDKTILKELLDRNTLEQIQQKKEAVVQQISILKQHQEELRTKILILDFELQLLQFMENTKENEA